MQRVILTIDSSRNAYLLMELIKQFDFVRSVELADSEIYDESEDEIFTDDLAGDFFLDDFQMTVNELRLQTLKSEKEKGMSKVEFINSLHQWRAEIEK